VGAQRDAEGTVYLLHFEQALRGARHYIGWTSNLEARIARHRRGGATFTGRFVAAGIGFRLARTWAGTPLLERELKRVGHAPLCPLCQR
jgi:hypothetical protein